MADGAGHDNTREAERRTLDTDDALAADRVMLGGDCPQSPVSKATPPRPDYERLRDEVERGRYPFAPEDEGVVFGRCEWLERVAWDLAYGDIGKRHAARRDYMANVR